jgi:hypothetical protein
MERLSGKPVELGPGSARGAGILVGLGMWLSHTKLMPGPKGQGSGQGRDPARPELWGSQWSMAPVLPHGAGARQGLRGREPEGHGYWCGLDPFIPSELGPSKA